MKESSNPRKKLSASKLESGDWLPGIIGINTQKSSHTKPWQLAIGYGFAVLFFLLGAKLLSLVCLSVSLIFTVVVLFVPKGAQTLGHGMQVFGRWVGNAVSFILLVPIYVLIFPLARAFMYLSGSDPLLIRDKNRISFWHHSDSDERKVRYVEKMFCSEAKTGSSKILLPLILCGILLVLFAEIGLRAFGYGSPVLYYRDPQVGYYPAPNQHITRSGGEITINNYGMRYPRDITTEKPVDVFRVVLIGDSTLYGGSYIDDVDTYAALLEDKLEAQYPSQKFEVLPIGVNAWGPFHKQAYIEKFGAFDADIAIVCAPLADMYREKYSLEAVPYFGAGSPPSTAMEEVAQHLVWRFSGGNKQNPKDTALPISNLTPIAAQSYGELVDAFNDSGAEVFFAIHPDVSEGYSDARKGYSESLYKALDGELSQRNVIYQHPLGMFEGEDQAVIYKDSVHLLERGHEIYADYLFEWLSSNSDKLPEKQP